MYLLKVETGKVLLPFVEPDFFLKSFHLTYGSNLKFI